MRYQGNAKQVVSLETILFSKLGFFPVLHS
jgi:hypothetical protein